jgi:DNA (cytosine-5)-methyltransferase 1
VERAVTHVSLFAGIGGFDLAAEWSGFETILQVERDPYCLRVLRKHWPKVKRVNDIRKLNAIRRKIGARAVDVLSGGFPCQPVSCAGKRESTADPRWLWPRMLDVVRCLRPTWVVAENVRGLLSIQLGVVFEAVCADLESAGYEVLPLVYPVAGVGAPHLRYRVFIVGHSTGKRRDESSSAEIQNGSGESRPENARLISRRFKRYGDVSDALGAGIQEQSESESRGGGEAVAIGDGENVAHAAIGRFKEQRLSAGSRTGREGTTDAHGSGANVPDSFGLGRDGRADDQTRGDVRGRHEAARRRPPGNPWESESGIRRVASGVRSRVDRLRTLGNAVSPYQALPIFQAIAAVERAL